MFKVEQHKRDLPKTLNMTVESYTQNIKYGSGGIYQNMKYMAVAGSTHNME